jgi:hypothetical protein
VYQDGSGAECARGFLDLWGCEEGVECCVTCVTSICEAGMKVKLECEVEPTGKSSGMYSSGHVESRSWKRCGEE